MNDTNKNQEKGNLVTIFVTYQFPWLPILLPFQQRYAHNPLSLYQTVQQCLSSEMHLVQRAEGVSTVQYSTVQYSEHCEDWTHFVFAASIFGESEIIPHLIAAGSGRLERHGQRHDIPDPAAAQCAQKVNPGMWDRNRENQTNARTPLDKLLQASSDIRYCYTVSQTSFLEKIF